MIRFLPVGLALLCIQVDYFALSLALPRIADGLHVSTTDLQWLVSGYMLAFGALLVPAGRLGDVLGRRSVLQTGVLLFGAMSIVCAVGDSPSVLITARVVQGAAAAMIMPTSFALISNATTDDERSHVMGTIIGISGVGTALGPVVGGVLAGTVGWRWVFWVNVPVAIVAWWMGRRLPNSRHENASLRGFDWIGTVTIAAGLGLLSYGLDRLDIVGVTAPSALGPILAGVALLIGFAVQERRVTDPLVRPALLRNRVFLVIMFGGVFANIGANVYIISATIDLQDIRRVSATAAGLMFMLASLGIAACGPLAGRLIERFPADLVLAVACLGGGVLVYLTGQIRNLPTYIVVLGVCGLFCGLGYSAAQIAIQNVLPPARAAEGSGLLLTGLICFGGMAIVIVSGVINGTGQGEPTLSGLQHGLTGTAVLQVLAGLSVVAARLRRRGRPAASTETAPTGPESPITA
jgi:MFS family permease